MSDTTGTGDQAGTPEAGPEGGSNKTWLWVALGVVVIVIIGLIIAAVAGNPDDDDDETSDTTTTTEIASTIPSTTELETTTTTLPADAETITVEGTGATNSDPFNLVVDRYRVEYSFPGDCQYSATLNSADTTVGYSEEIATGSSTTGETNLFGIQEGSHFVAMTMGTDENCEWKIVLTPAPA